MFWLGNTTESWHIANYKCVYLAKADPSVFQRIKDRL
jgi:hypothetical protein